MPTSHGELLTAGEAARLLDITPAGVVAAANQGRISVAARTERGIRLFTHEAVDTFRASRKKQSYAVR